MHRLIFFQNTLTLFRSCGKSCCAFQEKLKQGPGAFMTVMSGDFGGYALALLQNSIWYKRAWNFTLKSMADGLVYALLTAGTFGWLWPA